MTSSIAFLGAGLMGTPMIRRLLAAGYDVRVWNRSRAKLAPLLAEGASIAESPGDAVRSVDLVCLCLTDADAVEAVLFGDDASAAAAMTPGSLIVDFSTIGPERTRAIARRLSKQRAITWVDAPVSGGVKGATDGQLVIMCGGTDHDIERARPVMELLSKRISHVGPLGSGQAAKLCNQLIVATNVVAIAEALALAGANGLDPRKLPSALADGWADSLPLQIIGTRMASGTMDPPIVSIGTFAKDLSLVLKNTPDPLQLTSAASAIYAQADAMGIASADVTMLRDVIENQTPNWLARARRSPE